MKTKNDLLEFHAALKVAETLEGESEDIVKFLYGVDRNIAKTESEVKSIAKAKEFLPDYLKYDKERIALCEEMAKKDGKGRALKVLKDKKLMYDLFDKDGDYKKSFITALEKLNEKHKKALDNRTKQLKKYDEMLEEDMEFDTKDLYMVPRNTIPKDVAGKKTGEAKKRLFKLLLPMIVEE